MSNWMAVDAVLDDATGNVGANATGNGGQAITATNAAFLGIRDGRMSRPGWGGRSRLNFTQRDTED